MPTGQLPASFRVVYDSTEDAQARFWNTWDNLMIVFLVLAAAAFMGSTFVYMRKG